MNKKAVITHIETAYERAIGNREQEIESLKRYGHRYREEKAFGARVIAWLSEPMTYTNEISGNEYSTDTIEISVALNGDWELAVWDKLHANEYGSDLTVTYTPVSDLANEDDPIVSWLNEQGYIVAFDIGTLDQFDSVAAAFDELAKYNRNQVGASPNRIAYNVSFSYALVMANPALEYVIAPPNHYSKKILLSNDGGGLVVSIPQEDAEREIDRIKFVLNMYLHFGEIYTGE